MKDYRFYLEFPDAKTRNKSGREHKGRSGNVIALVFVNGTNGAGKYDAIAGVSERENSPVCGTSVGMDYLSKRCKRVPERVARAIHPALFVVLDEYARKEKEERRKR